MYSRPIYRSIKTSTRRPLIFLKVLIEKQLFDLYVSVRRSRVKPTISIQYEIMSAKWGEENIYTKNARNVASIAPFV